VLLEWVLHAMTLSHHEREANFQAYIRRRILFYAAARRVVAYLPVRKELGKNIRRFLMKIEKIIIEAENPLLLFIFKRCI
jgi:hypothetical protein